MTCRDVIPAAEELAQNELKSILKEHFLSLFLNKGVINAKVGSD